VGVAVAVEVGVAVAMRVGVAVAARVGVAVAKRVGVAVATGVGVAVTIGKRPFPPLLPHADAARAMAIRKPIRCNDLDFTGTRYPIEEITNPGFPFY
jgi:hypothetical protein